MAYLGHHSTLGVQQTLKRAIPCAGTGLHSGSVVSMTLHPAGPDHGIVFRRRDVAGPAAEIPARWDLVADTRLCTRLVNGHGTAVATVEHLLAACAALGLDNALIEVDAAEVPIMDGSAAAFVTLIESAGRQFQAAPRRSLVVDREVRVSDGDKWASLGPLPGGTTLDLDVAIAYDSAAIGAQQRSFRLSAEAFKADLQQARTFGFYREVAALQQAGLAQGGSLANAIVVDNDRVLNDGGLRYRDEFVRHKVLDAVGDLFTAGRPVIGRFRSHKAGHGLHNQLLRALFADSAAWHLSDGAAAPAEQHQAASA